jgi:phosphoribosylaminoimidazole synthetase
LDYFATGKLSVEQAKHVIAGIAKGCLESGCALVGGETAEMPGMYQKGDYDLAGFSVGAVPRSQLLPRIQEMRVDDVLVGIPSSGLHSNGFSLVRKIIELHRIDLLSPSPFKSDLPSLAEELLKPTRLYVKSCLPLMRKGLVKGAAHITGGGLIENLPRVLPCGLGARIYSNSWESPPVFDWLVKSGNLDTYESFRTFNMGIGMVLIVDPQNVESILESIPDACVIGVLLPLNEGVSEIVQIDV